eukprot:scaffold1670_cov370-Prasinococcus_capsulatus_cf.AAC.7
MAMATAGTGLPPGAVGRPVRAIGAAVRGRRGSRSSTARTTGRYCRCSAEVRNAATQAQASAPPKICVVGGGFGGLYTALKLDALPWPAAKPDITLIDKAEVFTFKPLLYEFVAEDIPESDVSPPFQELLARTSVSFLCAGATGIQLDPEGCKGAVQLDKGLPPVRFDWLVLSCGAESGVPSSLRDSVLTFNTKADALQLKQKLKDLKARGGRVNVCIVGGGYNGIELSAMLADELGDQGHVQIIDSGAQVLDFASRQERRSVQGILSSKGVMFAGGRRVSDIRELDGQYEVLFTEAGQAASLCADLVLWTCGNTRNVVPFAEELGQEATEMQADATLALKGQSNIFAVGDMVRVEGAEALPANAQVAFQQADYAAWNIFASISGRPLLPFRYQNLGVMMVGQQPVLFLFAKLYIDPPCVPQSLGKSDAAAVQVGANYLQQLARIVLPRSRIYSITASAVLTLDFSRAGDQVKGTQL